MITGTIHTRIRTRTTAHRLKRSTRGHSQSSPQSHHGEVPSPKVTRIYIRSCYYGNCWHEGISALRSFIRSMRLKGAYGILVSTITGECKKVTPRTVKEV